MTLRTFGLTEVREWNPCIDPRQYLPADWRGTVVDVLKMEKIPHADRIWLAVRSDFFSAGQLFGFTVWCARQIQHFLPAPCLEALEYAERAGLGKLPPEEAPRALASWTAAQGVGTSAWQAAWTIWNTGDFDDNAVATTSALGNGARASWAACRAVTWVVRGAKHPGCPDAAKNAAWASARALGAEEIAKHDGNARHDVERRAREGQVRKLIEILEQESSLHDAA